MKDLDTAAQAPISGTEAKEADRIAIFEYGIDSLFLMENASMAVSEYVMEHYKEDNEILILSGVGNNGADGVCIGKQLSERGYSPKLMIVGNLEKASYEFFRQLSEYKRLNGDIAFFKADTNLSEYAAPELLIDGVFGIGLKRNVEGIYREFLQQADLLPCEKIAVDVPSGINADDGKLMGIGIHASTTITFGRNKIGLTQGEGKSYAGKVLVRKIGIPDKIYENLIV